MVPAVTGAPGDGSKSLAAAIQRELSVKGVPLIDRPTASAYRVEGTVVMGQAEGGKQAIQIEWLVRDPQGKKLGTVSQKNEIAEGSLDGAWGKVADQAAGAAVQGIVLTVAASGVLPRMVGMIAVGASLTKAMWLAVEVETLARQYHGCLQIGTPPLLSKAEIDNVRARMAGYGVGGES